MPGRLGFHKLFHESFALANVVAADRGVARLRGLLRAAALTAAFAADHGVARRRVLEGLRGWGAAWGYVEGWESGAIYAPELPGQARA